jgi:monoamine oxidase
MLADRRGSAIARSAVPRVVIIGAGFGGLSCAFQLKRAGVQVTVLEARPRLGGRVHSLHTLLPGKKVEAGAELIGLNHPTWLAYAKHFGLTLNELPESEEAHSPILLNGRRILGEEVAKLWSALDTVLQSMRRRPHHHPSGALAQPKRQGARRPIPSAGLPALARHPPGEAGRDGDDRQ